MKLADYYKDYKWIKVKSLENQFVPHESWKDSYDKLARHHEEETKFLIAEVRKLAETIDALMTIKDHLNGN